MKKNIACILMLGLISGCIVEEDHEGRIYEVGGPVVEVDECLDYGYRLDTPAYYDCQRHIVDIVDFDERHLWLEHHRHHRRW